MIEEKGWTPAIRQNDLRATTSNKTEQNKTLAHLHPFHLPDRPETQLETFPDLPFLIEQSQKISSHSVYVLRAFSQLAD